MSESNDIDYSKFSLRDLHDCARQIDRSKYPDRYAQILEAIQKRGEMEKLGLTHEVQEAILEQTRKVGYVLIGLGILAGACTLWSIGYYLISLQQTISIGAPALIPLGIIFLGIQVSKHRMWALKVANYLFILQSVNLYTIWFEYDFNVGFAFPIGITISGFGLKVDIAALIIMSYLTKAIIYLESRKKESSL